MKISVNEFKGIMPKIANDKLPNNMAQTAADLKTASGELKAYRRSTPGFALSGSAYQTFFEYLEGGNNHWVYYDLIVHWVRSPTANDSFERMYLSGADSVNGKYMAFVNDLQGGGSFDFTTDFYFPGAPSGKAPTIAPAASVGDYVAYYYTYVSRYGEEGPPSAVGESAAATDDGRNDVDDIDYPSAADEHLTDIVGGEVPKIYLYRTATAGDGTADFLFCLEAQWFEETVTYVAGDYVFYGGGGTYDLYECTVGGVGTWAGGTHTFVSGENVLTADLGAVGESIFYDRAPVDLTNLRGHPNGFFVASKDNVLYFSEPYAPWAWPVDYQIPIDQTIIGVGIYGSTIVVATDGWIYTFSGPHPTSLYKSKLSFQPCLSQRGLAETDDGVLFPSLEGFQHVTAGGVFNMTQDMFKPEDWVDYELDTIHGTWYNKAYYGFYQSNDLEGGIILDILNGSITTFSQYHLAGHVALIDGTFRTIFNSDIDDPSTQYISTWDSDVTQYNNFEYKSPRYIMEKPVNFKVAQIILDSEFYDALLVLISEDSTLATLNAAAWVAGDRLRAPINDSMLNEVAFNGDTLYSLSSLGVQGYINFKVYVDGSLVFTKQVTDSNMFKLPRGFRHKKWEFGIEGMIPVKRMIIATSTEEIA